MKHVKKIAGGSALVIAATTGVLVLQGGAASAQDYDFYQRSTTFSVGGGGFKSKIINCDATSHNVVGGGVQVLNEASGSPQPFTYMNLISSHPYLDTNGKPSWRASYKNDNDGGGSISVNIYVICVKPIP